MHYGALAPCPYTVLAVHAGMPPADHSSVELSSLAGQLPAPLAPVNPVRPSAYSWGAGHGTYAICSNQYGTWLSFLPSSL